MKRTAKKSTRHTRSAPSPMGNPMADQVGPEFHDAVGMRHALGSGDELLEASELDSMMAASDVLFVKAFDGTPMFPTWQVRDGAVLAGLGDVLRAMAGQPAWSVALWICTVHDDLGDSPRGVLEKSGGSPAVVELAAATAERWS